VEVQKVKEEAETEGQLIHELGALRQKVAELETCLEQRKHAEEELRKFEIKYRFLYQESPSISLIIGKDGLLKDANKTALETFGYSNDEIVGKHVLEFVVPEHRQKSTAILEKALRDEHTPEIEVGIYSKDGSIHTILFSSGQILIHEDGSPTSILVTGIDITPRKQAEGEINKLLATIETAKEAINITSADGTIMYTNDAMDELFGYEKGELIGKSPSILNAGTNPEELTKSIIHTIKKEGYWEGEIHNKRKDGADFMSYARISALKDEDGRIIHYLSTQHDITERKKMEEALRQSETEYRALFETTGFAKVIVEEDMLISKINKEFELISGYSRAEMEGKKKWTEFVAEDDRERIRAYHRLRRVSEKAVPRSYEFHYLTKKGELRTGSATIDLIQGTKKSIASIVDITDRKHTEEELRETRDYCENLFNYANAPIIVWDPSFTITRFNHAFEHLTGRRAIEVVGKPLDILFPEDKREEAMTLIRRALAGERWETVEISILRADGTVKIVLWNSATLYAEDGTTPIATIAQGQDITDRKCAEEKLRQTSDYLENLFNYANAPIIVWDPSFTITRFNHAFEHLTGRRAIEVVGKPLDILFPEDKREEAMTLIRRALAGERWETVEISILRADGTVKIVLWNSATLYAEDGTTPIATIAQGQDITDRKRAEEALQSAHVKMRATFDSIREPMNVVDLDFNLMEVNDALIKTYGLPNKESVIGHKCFEVMKGRKDMCPNCAVAEVYRTKDPTYRISTSKDEISTEERSFEIFAYPIMDEHGELYGAVEFTRDITDRKQAEEQIKTSLREKEILLREIHHRVKNNLQIISTLLYLQSRSIKEKKASEMFKDSQNRIKSMALIHDKLYQFKDLGKIDVAGYIRDLATDLFHSYGIKPDGIKLKINVYEVLLGVNTAIPCGLMINELVSNALKHAFPDGKKGEIRIELIRSVNEKTFTLIVSDNGIGFPEDLDFRNTKTLGLQLVITLVDQLDGIIELDRRRGTEFKITFAEQ
jgi:PAS domain S-box-containing protein